MASLLLLSLLTSLPAARGGALPAPRAPYGVNLGGWLCLEDWFFSGPDGADVSTEGSAGQGACLPPLLPHAKEPWPSEGILARRLADELGAAKAIRVFEAHRHSFIEDSDLRKISELGVRVVRVPLTWAAFAHGLAPLAPEVYGKHSAELETVIVPDPFYSNTTAFVTVPNKWLRELLRKGHALGLQFLLDLHAFPGGSSEGTYNGVFPQRPAFWKERTRVGKVRVPLRAAGQMVVDAFLKFCEDLTGPERHALAGVTLMNEPAHLSRSAEPPFAEPGEVLEWLGAAARRFFSGKLAARGVKLYMNMIETAFPEGEFWNATVPWWRSLLSEEERHSAVFDVHHYIAWNGYGGAVGKSYDNVAVLCDRPVEELAAMFAAQAGSFAWDFAQNVHGNKACSEFSAGTNKDGWNACDDLDVTRALLEAQVREMGERDIEAFFWSWRMPYGPIFERGWSLKVNSGLEDSRVEHACSLRPKRAMALQQAALQSFFSPSRDGFARLARSLEN